MTNKLEKKRKVEREDRVMKKKGMENECTKVVKLGMSFFTTVDSSYPESVETVESREMEAALKKHKREKKDGRLYKFVKKHFLQRRNSSNDVQEIRIVPEGDELKWARRSAGSAASRSSNETTGSDVERLEVVHDMAEEYVPEV